MWWPLTLTYIFKVIRPWLRKSCLLCSVYSSGWILSMFGTFDLDFENRVCSVTFSVLDRLFFWLGIQYVSKVWVIMRRRGVSSERRRSSCSSLNQLRNIVSWTLGNKVHRTWWRHQMETFSALLALYAGNSPIASEFPAQIPVTRNFDVFFDLRLNERLSKQSWGWWSETPPWSLWRQCNDLNRNEKIFIQ